MSQHTATPEFGSPDIGAGLRDTARQLTGHWWAWLVTGIAWVLVALVILQFDQASITTVGVLVGVMFTLGAIQNFALASLEGPDRWLWALFGVLFLISGFLSFISPEDTFAGLADMLGFLFLVVGVWWMVRAFLQQAVSPFWWVGLIGGILMTIVAFWTAGQFFIDRAYMLLVLSGIWALMEGIENIVRAFAVRGLHKEL